MPSARHTCPPLGRRSSVPPGSRTTGSSSGATLSISAASAGSSSCSGSRQVYGSRARRTYSTIVRVAADDRGPRISTPSPLVLLQRLAPRDERREQHVAERAVLEQQRPQHLALDRDVAQRLSRDGGQVHGLARHQVQLAEEAGGPVTDDLVARGVEDRHLALQDGDERIPLVADRVQHVPGRGPPLLPQRSERLELRSGEDRAQARHGDKPTERPVRADSVGGAQTVPTRTSDLIARRSSIAAYASAMPSRSVS